ncbi:hypothetical protein DFJ73DRAFT_642221 [Zopfochytrium polystomum]|nr:hypothetical protein DFJ73DRAFT_642221 [Zopfochytrium polystomum]
MFGKDTFTAADIPRLDGKVIIVTGATSGIGKVSAEDLAAKGAHVVMACRSQPKTEGVIADIKKTNPAAKVEFMPLDLASLASVKAFADAYIAKNQPIDVLLNNAGVMSPAAGFTLTKDGIEVQMGANHLGHFYLTNLLLPVIEDTARKNGSARVVTVSSELHKPSGGLDLENVNNPAAYQSLGSYQRSKLANILFTRELQKRVDAKGANIYVNTLHPGLVQTDLVKTSAFATVLGLVFSVIALTPKRGAISQLYLATSPDVVAGNGIKGQYYNPLAKPGKASAEAQDDKLAAKLWKWSEDTLKEKGFAL